MPILCQFHANANIRFVPAGYIMVEKSMNSSSLGFRFPTMLMHGEETEILDLLDEFVPMNLGLWCTLVDLLLQPSQCVFFAMFHFNWVRSRTKMWPVACKGRCCNNAVLHIVHWKDSCRLHACMHACSCMCTSSSF